MPKWYWDMLSLGSTKRPEGQKLIENLELVRQRLVSRGLLEDKELTGKVDARLYRLCLFYKGDLLCVLSLGGVEWQEI